MMRMFKWIIILLIVDILLLKKGYALIGPIRILSSGSVLFVPCDAIKLAEEHIELYHHPLGIWVVEYRALLQNLRSEEISQSVGFPSGFDLRLIEGDLVCDRFENFKVFVDDQRLTKLNFMIKCSNFVETTNINWSADDGSRIGYLNTWQLSFKADQAKWITVSFSFIVTKMPPIYNPKIKDNWYLDLVNWIREDYSKRAENQYQLPLNIGSFWAFYPDSTVIRTYIAQDWLTIIRKSERHYDPNCIIKHEFSEPVGLYSPPEVKLDTLTVDQLQGKSPTEVLLLRNSFFAKYGRKFQNPIIKKYFDAQPWYSENSDYQNWYLTPWDIKNIKLIHEFEESRK